MGAKDQKGYIQGYEIKREILFENNRGFVLAENPDAEQPFVTWMFTEAENGERDYYIEHYTASKDLAAKVYGLRVAEYQKESGLHEQGAYIYYSTQRPVDINTFPITENGPVRFVNFDTHEDVEQGDFQAWGYLVYDAPLTEKDIYNYELRAASGNPDMQTVKYYDISETAARRAKEANSFYDYKPGSATADYRAMVDAAREMAEKHKQRIDPMYHEKVDRLLDTYARKLAENYNNRSAIDARVPSVMIAGPSNFPVRQKHKQNAARDKNWGEYEHIQGLLDKIRGTGMGGIRADDDLAVEKLEAKLAGLEESQETMKKVNAYYRKHKTLDGCPDLSEDTINKLKATMARHYRQGAPPFPSWQLSNNSAVIRSTRQRIEELKNRSEFAGWEFEGGRAEANEAENRLQLFFDEKPTDEQRKALKSNGFKWAPSHSAWQRQLTRNAIHSAGYVDFIKPKDGQTPYKLQPFARKEAQDRGDR